MKRQIDARFLENEKLRHSYIAANILLFVIAVSLLCYEHQVIAILCYVGWGVAEGMLGLTDARKDYDFVKSLKTNNVPFYLNGNELEILTK